MQGSRSAGVAHPSSFASLWPDPFAGHVCLLPLQSQYLLLMFLLLLLLLKRVAVHEKKFEAQYNHI